MKQILVVVSLVMAAFSFQANAATVNLGVVNDFASFKGEFRGTGNSFSDTFNFSTIFQSVISASATNSFAKLRGKIVGKIADFSATLDGVALALESKGSKQELSFDNLLRNGGKHSLVVSGKSVGSYGGSIAVAQTPIPAAVWLFGSALMGMMGMRRKKA